VEQIQVRRHAEAEQAKAETEATQRETAGKHPLLQELARKSSILTDELSEITGELDRIDGKKVLVVEESKRIADEFRSARQRLEISGLTQALGQLFIDRRNKLPDPGVYRKEANEREQAIAEANLRQIRYSEERRQMRDLDAFVDTLTADLPTPAPADLRNGLRELAQQRKRLLDKAAGADDAYLQVLGDLDYASSQLMETVARYDDYLAERLLWVRSGSPVNLDTVRALPKAIGWFISPHNWLDVVQVILYEATTSPLLWMLILVVLLLLWKARAIRAAILATALPLRRVGTDRIAYTLQGIGLSLLLALSWPLLFVTLGWQLDASLHATSFTKAIGRGALAVAFGLFAFRTFRLLCIPGGGCRPTLPLDERSPPDRKA
jgi:potassium efflux system protein